MNFNDKFNFDLKKTRGNIKTREKIPFSLRKMLNSLQVTDTERSRFEEPPLNEDRHERYFSAQYSKIYPDSKIY